ncbi:MAG: ParA family protein [Verrucomicrobiota bacterium]
MKIIALSNHKGGVGKTTSAVNLGAYLASAGQRTCILDLDPQANATSAIGLLEHQRSIYEAMLGGGDISDLPIKTQYENLSILPANIDLSGVEVELANASHRLTSLRDPLHAYRPIAPFDYMLIDCPPSLGVLMTCALAAADEILIPVQCEYLSLIGLAKMTELFFQIRETGINPGMNIEGIILTMADERTNLSRSVIDDVREQMAEVAYSTVIPRSIRLGEAPSHGQAIIEYAPESKGAVAYQALADEFLQRRQVALAAA